MEKLEKKTNRKRFFKIILLIIVVLLVLFLIHAIRNYVIITSLQNKVKPYTQSTNFHIKSVANEGDGTEITINMYQKENRQVIILERSKDGKVTNKISSYNNGERIDTFYESNESKIVKLNSANSISIEVVDYLKTDNKWQNFIYGIPTIIKTTNYNGKICYKVNNFLSPYYLLDYDTTKNNLIIEKDTGLCLKNETGKIITERTYEFDSVNDDIFAEPDISQYKLQENN